MLYRLRPNETLQYYGEQGGWHHSFSYTEKLLEFLTSDLTEEIPEADASIYISQQIKTTSSLPVEDRKIHD